jgi:hypothetical protein
VISFSADLQRLGEARCTSGKKHEFLEGQFVTSMRSAIDDIKGGHRKNVRRLDTSQLREVLIQRDALEYDAQRSRYKVDSQRVT